MRDQQRRDEAALVEILLEDDEEVSRIASLVRRMRTRAAA